MALLLTNVGEAIKLAEKLGYQDYVVLYRRYEEGRVSGLLQYVGFSYEIHVGAGIEYKGNGDMIGIENDKNDAQNLVNLLSQHYDVCSVSSPPKWYTGYMIRRKRDVREERLRSYWD